MDTRVGQFPSTQDHAKQNGGHWPTFEDLSVLAECTRDFASKESISSESTEIHA